MIDFLTTHTPTARVIFTEKASLDIFSLKPIFHWKLGSRWIPNASEIYTKEMKYTWPTPAFCVGTQSNLYSTDWRRGLALGLTQILGLALGVWRRETQIFTFRYQHVGIPNAKLWHQGHCPTPAPDARYFVFWWNIGFRREYVWICDCICEMKRVTESGQQGNKS